MGYDCREIPIDPDGEKLFGFGLQETLQELRYGTMLRECKGVCPDSRPMVTALVLKDEKRTVAILSLDVLGIDADIAKQLESDTKIRLGIDTVLLTTTHSHSAPALVSTCTDDRDANFVNEVSRLSLLTLEEAKNNAVPSNLLRGITKLAANRNRRSYEKNREVDRTVRVLQFQNSSTNIRLVRYTCHPVCLGRENLHASSDYVGYLRKGLTDCQLIFVNGCAGNINPSSDGEQTDLSGRGYEAANQIGIRLAKEVAELQMTSCAKTELTWARVSAKIWFNTWCPGRLNQGKPCDVKAIGIGDTFLVGLPGEPFCETGYRIAQNFASADVWILGYTDGYFGYLIDEEAEIHGAKPPPNEFDYEAGSESQSAAPNIGYKIQAKDTEALESSAIESIRNL